MQSIKSIQQLFATQVTITPDKIAIQEGNVELTYLQIDVLSNRLASKLSSACVAKGDVIGIALPPSINLLISQLAIFKLGCIYLPIDITNPLGRINYILSDSEAKFIITNSNQADKLIHFQGGLINIELADFAHESRFDDISDTGKEDIAALYYTSGSTGLPKGVLIKQGAIINRFQWYWEKYPYNQTDIACHKTAISFFDSFTEVFSPLLRGIKVVIAPANLILDVKNFVSFLAETQVSILVLIPSLLNVLLEQNENDIKKLEGVNTWIVSGEPLNYTLIEKTRNKLGAIKLLNLYGSTEIAGDVTFYEAHNHDPVKMKEVPIGRPIDNVEVYIFSPTLVSTPVNVIGEIYVSGACLAQGYLGAERLNQDKFIFHPILEKTLFRTGDLGYFLPSGNIVYVGRSDNQIKIRGKRVSLEEIDAYLSSHPMIKSACTISCQKNGATELIACVVMKENLEKDEDRLQVISGIKNYLLSCLPNYMVPNFYSFYELLPCTVTGKIDRVTLFKQYKDSDETILYVKSNYSAPANSMETLIAHVWTQHLFITKIGREDNFFEIGGTSITAAYITAIINKKLNIAVAASLLMENPKLSDYAIKLQTFIDQHHRSLVRNYKSDDSQNYPLSPLQSIYWFASQIDELKAAYNIMVSLQFNCRIDEEILRIALTELMKRHTLLKTIFKLDVEGEPCQFVLQEVPTPLIKGKIQYNELDLYYKKNSNLLFQLDKFPPWELHLICTEFSTTILLLKIHHILIDGLSISVFWHELSELYKSFVEMRIPNLPPLPKQYTAFTQDYIFRLKNMHSELIPFWRKYLEKIPEMHELQTDKSRPKFLTHQGAHHLFNIPSSLLIRCELLAQNNNTTLFTVLLSTFYILLYRYSQQKDITIGIPFSVNHDYDTINLLGCFINVIPLRVTDFKSNNFISLLLKIHEEKIRLEKYALFPFPELVKLLKISPDKSKNSIFQIMCVYEEDESEKELFGQPAVIQDIYTNTAKVDITLFFKKNENSVSCTLEYATDLFLASTIERLSEHYIQLLQTLLSNPNEPVEKLCYLNPQEKEKLLNWCFTEKIYEENKPIPLLFKEQVEKTPYATAVIFREQRLSYQELDERSNQVAHYLISHGVAAESIIAVSLSRSLELIIAILGVLKSGGVYLPLDTQLPMGRIKIIINDAKPLFLITQPELQLNYSFFNGQVLLLNEEWFSVGQMKKCSPVYTAQIHNAMYVIYTSGSTGQPKGVVNEYAGVINRLHWMQEQYPLTSIDRVLQKTSISFDVSIWELFWPIIVGAQLVIAPPHIHKDPYELTDYIYQNKITVIHFVPSMLDLFLCVREIATFITSLKFIFASGEALSRKTLRKFYSLNLANTELHNLYGPTEAAIDVTYWHCRADYMGASVPIGVPIKNTKLYILDGQLMPVPINVPGELCISGAALARGYLNNLDITEKVFIDNPFSTDPLFKRLYKTGDLAKFTQTGDIIYLGRIDTQIKLGGNRIELAEIEQAITLCGIENVVVNLGKQENKEFLIGYLLEEEISKKGVFFNNITQNIINNLSYILPEYMIPRFFMLIKEFPLNVSGKLDRKSLPVPRVDLIANPSKNKRIIKDELESIITQICLDVLQVKFIAPNDNLFHLGINSLAMIKIQYLLREKCNFHVSLNELYNSPYIAAILSYAKKAQNLPQPVNIPKAFFLSSIPVSTYQEQLILAEILSGVKGTYEIQFRYNLTGKLEVDRLQQALNRIIERHEILRTCFVAKEGAYYQHILPVLEMEIVPELINDAVLAQITKQGLDLPLLLGDVPCWQVRLFIHESNYILVFGFHHALIDGYSIKLFLKELSDFYNDAVIDKPALAIQYADYTVWHQNYLSGEMLEKKLNYWESALKNKPNLLMLPLDKPRTERINHTSDTYWFSLDKEIFSEIEVLIHRENVTLFTFLLSVLYVFLYRYTNQEEMIVGAPFMNRPTEETFSLIGLFVNVLALPATLSKDMPFDTLLKQVQGTVIQSQYHGDLPFEKLVSHLKIARSLFQNPLFQVMLVVENKTEQFPLALSDLRIAEEPCGVGYAKFDLVLQVKEYTDRLECGFEYANELFEQATIMRMAKNFACLLQAIVDCPNKAISQLQLVSDEELALLEEWSGVEKPFAQKSVCDLILEQVKAAPTAPALEDTDCTLSYEEMDKEANRLAHYLVTQGVVPETRIAIMLGRTVWNVVALLGILKAGATFVPIDPTYPDKRKEFILSDSSASWLITESAYQMGINNFAAGLRCFIYDQEWDTLHQYSDEVINHIVSLEQLAYIIYTSGSTGVPKGVMIKHKGLSNLLLSEKAQMINLNRNSRVLQTVTFAFDASIWDWAGALAHGAMLYIADWKEPIEPKLINKKQITISVLPAGVLAKLDYSEVPTLKTIIVMGDVSQRVTLDKWAKKVKLFIGYGPTEATICTTLYQYTGIGAPSSIGRPISNVKLYILDSFRRPVPIGVVGELFISGPSLASGYLNQQAIMAKKFIPNIFRNASSSLMYATGDLVKFCQDGNLLFVGRCDNQIKYRGYLIDCGEIENFINKIEGVEQSVLIVSTAKEGEKQLKSYLKLKDNASLSQYAINDLLKNITQNIKAGLPYFMMPDSFNIVDEFPLTGNGKIDYKKLEEISPTTSHVSRLEKFSCSHVEQVLMSVCKDILFLQQIDLETSFFHMGGNSILGLQLISKMNKIFHINLTIESLFKHQTIQELASVVDNILSRNNGHITIKINNMNRLAEIPVSTYQEQLILAEILSGVKGTYEIQFRYNLTGKLEVDRLQQALNRIIERHEILRTCFVAKEGAYYQHILPVLEMEIVPQLINDAVLTQITKQGLDLPLLLGDVPCWQVRLFIHESNYILVFGFHHALIDGYSIKLFLKELSDFYNDAVIDKPALAIQYADYTVWHQNYLSGEMLEKKLNYWESALKNKPNLLMLPLDKPRTERINHTSDTYWFSLDKEIFSEIEVLIHRENVTLFTFLLSVLYVFLYRYTNQEEMIVGAPFMNRPTEETFSLIGLFVNVLALPATLSKDMPFDTLLKQVQGTVIQSQYHGDLPFEKLVSHLKIARSLFQNPLFQVMLVVENKTEQFPLALSDLRIAEEPCGVGYAKFDLVLQVKEYTDRLECGFEYANELFEQATIMRMAKNFACLLQAIVDCPNKAISQLQLVSDEELALLEEWSGVEKPFAQKSVCDLILEQVKAAPTAPALEDTDCTLSYEEMDKEANRLAHYLVTQGVVPETRIAIMLGRTVWNVVALLGILKAGATFVPIDPTYPDKRKEFILSDSSASWLITESAYQMGINNFAAGLRCFIYDQEWDTLHQYSDEVINHIVSLEQLAYIIYTSGSTGVPKGVMIKHKDITERLQACQDYLPLLAEQIFIHLFSFTFDGSVLSSFWPLIAGQKIIIPSLNQMVDGSALLSLIQTPTKTTIFATPSIIKLFLFSYSAKTFGKLRNIIAGGENVSSNLLNLMKLNAEQVFNFYGPTECTIVSTVWQASTDDFNERAMIGNPLPNIKAFILNDYLHFVPVGAIGELCITGSGLGNYMNANNQSQYFIEGKYYVTKQHRLYRTGDLASFDKNGKLHFWGRKDTQVKINGQRIELDEIKAKLFNHPAVRDAFIKTNRNQLEAYLILKQSHRQIGSQFINDLDSFLSSDLPGYMRPNKYYILENISLTSNGKVDLNNIKATKALKPMSFISFPRDNIEFQLSNIWKEILNLKSINVDDNFFTLGGNSILGTIVIEKIKRLFNITLSIGHLFQASTIENLSKIIRSEVLEEPEPIIEIIKSNNPTNSPLILIHTGDGWAYPYLKLNSLLDDRPVYGINNPKFGKDKDKFHTIKEMAGNYVQLINEKNLGKDIVLGGWSFGGLVAIEMARILQSQGVEVENVILIDSAYTQNIKAFERQSGVLEAFLSKHQIEPSSEQGKKFVNEIHHNTYLLSKHSPVPYEGQVILLKANRVEEEWQDLYSDPYNGLRPILKSLPTVVPITGTHSTLLDNENLGELAKKLIFCLNQPKKESQIMKEEILKQREKEAAAEQLYFDSNKILSSVEPVVQINLADIYKRATSIWFEGFSNRPQDIFYINIGEGRRLIGRKMISRLRQENKIWELMSSEVSADMLIGVFVQEKLTDDGIILFYKEVTHSEKIYFFENIMNDFTAEIYHPYPYLAKEKLEAVCPIEFWDPDQSLIENLNAGEVILRDYTMDFLAKIHQTSPLDGKTFYDPSCSTGAFLGAIKEFYPTVKTIGQDINAKMVDIAKQKVDIVYSGDASEPCIEDNSVDFIFIRFLNFEVVDTNIAHSLVTKIANRCKDGGYIIILGHTPVLINALWFNLVGLEVISSIGVKDNTIFQYYVVKKHAPVLSLDYHQFHPMNQHIVDSKVKEVIDGNQAAETNPRPLEEGQSSINNSALNYVFHDSFTMFKSANSKPQDELSNDSKNLKDLQSNI